MNGVRSTYMRKGYLLTALAAAVLLAASSGTAYAQRVSIGFVDTSGEISEKASLDANSPEAPQMITVRVRGLLPGDQRTDDIDSSIPTVSITPNKDVFIAVVDAQGNFENPAAADFSPAGTAVPLSDVDDDRLFDFSDEIVLMVAQSAAGSGDGNWLDEKIELKLTIGEGTASVSPDVFTLTAKEANVAPVAKFLQPDFTLSEDSTRTVKLNVASAIPGVPVPTAAGTTVLNAAGAAHEYTEMISVRVSNYKAIVLTSGTTPIPAGETALAGCPSSTHRLHNTKLFHIDITDEWAEQNFANTGVLSTAVAINALAIGGDAADTADLVIKGCGDKKGISDPRITLTILPSNLSESVPTIGDITIGAPLTISVDSDEALPTLSFSPTDVTIDEGGSTSTVLLAEGKNSGDVKMVKLMVEGDALVSLMQDGEMLEEMDGHVYVDLGGSSSARLMAMSHSDPDLMDGDMAFKAWKLMEGSAEGVDIGEGYSFKVDVRGSTAVPALPLIGQLLLALFLMAGGARLYRRRQG